jgi:hypothetical protein
VSPGPEHVRTVRLEETVITTSTTRAVLAASLALALGGGVLAGCGDSGPSPETSSGATTTTTPTATAPTTTAPTTTAPAIALALTERVLQDGELAGVNPRAPEVVDAEELVATASDDEHQAGDLADLKAAGFVTGVLGRFDTPDDVYALSFAAQVDPAKAGALVEKLYADLIAPDAPASAVDLPVPGIPGARAISLTVTQGTQVRGSAVVFADGAFVYGLQFAQQGTESLDRKALDAVAKLYARVKGAPAA